VLKQGLVALTIVAGVFAANVSAPSAATASVRTAAGSCQGGTVPSVVDATFICLSVGGPCAVLFQQDYAKFGFQCAAGRLVKPRSVSGPAIADAFLNTKSNDLTTRMTTFKVAGAPPILHLTFKQALTGPHRLSVDVHNATIDAGRTYDLTLQKGWQFTYEELPAPISNSTAGSYRVNISIDGTGRKQLTYSVTQ
jgi:hypothetical protein